MAAFEAVSTMTFQPDGRESIIDYRTVRLPARRPQNIDYDPREHREPKNPIKEWMAYFNVLRSLFGAGILGMPVAISQTGIILGPFLALMTGILVTHMHLQLLKSLNEISRQLKVPYISYRYGFRLALLRGPPFCKCIGKRGPTLIATFMIMSQLAICICIVIMTTDSLRDIMDWETSRPAIVMLFIPYLLLQHFMKDLKIISYVGMIGNVFNILGLLIAVYHVFQSPQCEIFLAKFEPIPIMFAFGTCLFNLCSIGVILAMDKALLHPKVMTKKYGVIRVGILIPTGVFIVFGCLGYWSFGTIEENLLRSLPFDDYSAMVCIGLYLVAVAFSYPIQCYPGVQVIREVVEYYNPYKMTSESTLNIVERIARPAFVCTTFGISYLVPIQAPLVAFVGNLCTTLLALVFPATMDLCLRYPNEYGTHSIILIKNIVIIVFGLITSTFGVFQCIYLMYIRIQFMDAPKSFPIYQKD